MRKAMVVLLAVVAAAALAWAQPAPGPNCPQAPQTPQAPMATGMGAGGGMHGGQGMMRCGKHGGQGMMGCGKHGGQGMMECGMRGHGRMGRDMGDCGGGAGLAQFRKELDLSNDQVERLEQLKLNHRMNMIGARADVERAELRLKELLRKDDASTQEVGQAIDQVAQLRAGIQKQCYSQRQECLSVLTDAQKEKLRQLREERRDERREFRQGQGRDRIEFRDRRFGTSR